MASYHCTYKIGHAGKAAPHAQYINREGRYKKHKADEELVYTQSTNMPEWAENKPLKFWQAADIYERSGIKLSGRAYREIEIALPNELTKEQNIAFVKDFSQKQFGDSYVYSLAIHNKKATLDNTQDQPHAHIMFCERQLDGIPRSKIEFFKRANGKKPERGGCKKNPLWNKKERLLQIRKDYQDSQNMYLDLAGHKVRVDSRSHKARREEAIQNGHMELAEKLDVPPQMHLGAKLAQRVSRALKQYLKNAKTPEEKDFLQNEYLQEKEPSAKVRLAYAVKEFKHLYNQLETEREREKQKTVPFKTTSLTIPEIQNILYNKSNEKEAQAEQIFKKYLIAKKQVLTEERVTKMALSTLTKGQYNKVKKEIANNSTKIEQWNRKLHDFKTQGPQGILSILPDKKRNLNETALLQEKALLIKEKNSLNLQKEEILNFLQQPENKDKLEKIKNEIFKANLPKKQQAEHLYAQYSHIKKLANQLQTQRNAIKNMNTNERVPFTPEKSTTKIIQATEKLISGISKSKQMRGLTANLHSEHER